MLQIGQKVYSDLHGGRDGVIYAIHGQQRPESVGRIAGFMSCGGNASFDIVFDDGTETKQLPESILRGIQWTIHPEVVTAHEICVMREFAATEKVRKEAEATKKSEEFVAAVAALKVDSEYSNLQQVGQGAQYNKLVAINLRRELKAAFPGIKFSVKCDGYDSVKITWTDGPTKAAVEQISNKYSGGHFDGMEDMYHVTRSPWTEVFGSAKYIFVVRKHSPEAMTAAVQQVCKKYGWPPIEVKTSSFDGSAHLGSRDHYQQKVVYGFLEGR